MTAFDEFQDFALSEEIDENITQNSCNNTVYIEFVNSSIYWTVVDLFLMFVIVTGNVITIMAVTMCRNLKKRVSNKCILNLAVSDLTVGLTLPYHIAFYLSAKLRNEKETCIMKFALIILACSASIVNVIIVAVDRYIAILYPLHYTKYMSKLVIRVLMIIAWTASVSISIVPVFWNNWKSSEACCDMHVVLPKAYATYVVTPLFSIMWLIMMVVYWKIWREVVKHTSRMRAATCNPSMKRDWKSLQVVLMILGSFTICWLPYVIVVCVQVISSQKPNIILYMVLLSVAKVNSGINPIIYAWKNRDFRKAFMRLLRCKNPNYRQSDIKLQQASISSVSDRRQLKTISKGVQENDLILPNAK